jgi:hypothetical protein
MRKPPDGDSRRQDIAQISRSCQDHKVRCSIKAVYTKLKNAVDEGATAAHKAQNVKTALQEMAAVLESGRKFW